MRTDPPLPPPPPLPPGPDPRPNPPKQAYDPREHPTFDPVTVRITACRSCGQPIWWGYSRTGKLTPYDATPPLMAPTATSHFGTCPDAKRWSRGKGAAR